VDWGLIRQVPAKVVISLMRVIAASKAMAATGIVMAAIPVEIRTWVWIQRLLLNQILLVIFSFLDI